MRAHDDGGVSQTGQISATASRPNLLGGSEDGAHSRDGEPTTIARGCQDQGASIGPTVVGKKDARCCQPASYLPRRCGSTGTAPRKPNGRAEGETAQGSQAQAPRARSRCTR